MKILVIGGSGFLSGTIVREALARGHDVWTVTRGKRVGQIGVTSIVADRQDRPAFARAVSEAGEQWDLVIDSIGFTGDDARQDVDVFSARTDRLVFISTDFVYARPRPWRIDETYEHFETGLPYGRGKRDAEKVLIGSTGPMAVTILRPCHIYGPGSQLGCLPEHGRDVKLLDRLRRGETLKLVGGGYFLQQPVFAPDLARMALSCAKLQSNEPTVYHAAGPDVVESRDFYELIAKELGTTINIEEVPIAAHLAEHPGNTPFCCHRVYAMEKAIAAGLDVPKTRLADGLAAHVRSM